MRVHGVNIATYLHFWPWVDHKPSLERYFGARCLTAFKGKTKGEKNNQCKNYITSRQCFISNIKRNINSPNYKNYFKILL